MIHLIELAVASQDTLAFWEQRLATLSPGFAVDEDPDHLGEELRLPKRHEHLSGRLEHLLTPVENPRAPRRQSVGA